MSKRNKQQKKIEIRGPGKRQSGFHHSKKLGQNFLTEDSVINEIVYGSEVSEETLVIEIGPGEGALTREFVDVAGGVIAIELDERLLPELNAQFATTDNCRIVHGDILETDVSKLIEEGKKEFGTKETVIVGNLPYYITTPIIMYLLRAKLDVKSITVMMQKEVADRLLAEPGTHNTGAITYAVHYHCMVSKVCDVGRECFYPVPKVDSCVIRMDLRDEKAVIVSDERALFRYIKAGFTQRRKTLLNSLSSLGTIEKEDIRKALESIGIKPERRAESLTLKEFADLTAILLEAEKNV